LTDRVPATVSLVVPTFNQGNFIEECLSSIAAQSYHDFEVIIQDSLSEDETESICRNYEAKDSRFRYFREKDQGQSDAINRGLARSKGIFWNWICSDDYYTSPDSLDKLVRGLQATTDPRFVGAYGDVNFVSEDGQTMWSSANEDIELTRDHFRMRWAIAQPACIFLRQAVVDVGGVNPKLELGMDLDLVLRMLEKQHRLSRVEGLIANIRLQSNAKSMKYQKQTAITALKILNEHFDGNCVTFESEFFKEYLKVTKSEFTSRSAAYRFLKDRYGSRRSGGLQGQAASLHPGHDRDGDDMEVANPTGGLWICRYAVRAVKKIVATALLFHLRWKIRWMS
jgi:glycosyltransferase involved in cell wall biosynthesis